MTPLQAIRAKCIDCSCGNRTEVRECPITTCPLYQFRRGKNPNRAGVGGNIKKDDSTQKNARELGFFDQITLNEKGVTTC